MTEEAFGAVASQDPRLEDAIRRIHADYGDIVSIVNKKKALLKFGRSRTIGPNQPGQLTIFQDTGQAVEVLATQNKVGGLSSSDTGDFGTVLRVETHTLDTGTGFTFYAQDVTCQGRTQANLGVAGARAGRMYVKPLAWPLQPRPVTGTIYLYDTGLAGGLTAGVPNVPSATKAILEGDTGWSDTGVGYNIGKRFNQTEKLATTLDYETYWICTQFYLSVTRSSPQNAKVDADVVYKQLGGIWRPVGMELNIDQAVTSAAHDSMDPYIIIPKNSDVSVVAQSSLANTTCAGYINGYLAKVIRSV